MTNKFYIQPCFNTQTVPNAHHLTLLLMRQLPGRHGKRRSYCHYFSIVLQRLHPKPRHLRCIRPRHRAVVRQQHGIMRIDKRLYRARHALAPRSRIRGHGNISYIDHKFRIAARHYWHVRYCKCCRIRRMSMNHAADDIIEHIDAHMKLNL